MYRSDVLQSCLKFTISLFQVKWHLLSTVLLSKFQSSRGALKSLSEAVPITFHGSDGNKKRHPLQDQYNFRSFPKF